MKMMKMAESSPNRLKCCGKRRDCLLPVISSFSVVLSKDMYCKLKMKACLGKG